MATKWSEDLAIGVKAIDEQHKGIFNRVDNLLNAMRQGKGKDEIGKVYAFLADYVVRHFKDEEDLMSKYNFDGCSKQKEEHTRFIKEFSGLKREFETAGTKPNLVIDTQRKLCDWLTNHISSEDKKIGTFMKMKG